MNASFMGPALVALGLISSIQLRGILEALALGVTVLLIDYGWFRFRVQRAYRGGTSLKPFSIIGVFLVRLLTIVIFLAAGGWWLDPGPRRIFYWALLTIPIWNLLGAIKLSNRP